ncbi:MAG: DUF262 domain-containing protein [Polyangiaceae bacterium]|nr:DUF262 domain-containing protein [Polyangiaceae bacterium]
MRLPAFQRPLKWETKDRTDLLDSMERGYPIGTLLLWKRPLSASGAGRKLDPGLGDPDDGDVYLVVDGQQRITTLWESLGREPRDDERAMVFEIASATDSSGDELAGNFVMRRLTRAEREGPLELRGGRLSLPLHLALDATALSEAFSTLIPRDVKRRCFDIGKRLREYPVPIYVIEGSDIEVGKHVFDRVNSTGKRLERQEIFDALIGGSVDVEDGGLGIALAPTRDLGFGEIDKSTALKALEAVRGDKVGKSDAHQLGREEASRDLERTGVALRMAVQFLRRVGFPHVAVLPYELPLVVLARFFALYSAPHPKSRVSLRRWVWRGSLREVLGGASGSLQQHVDDVVEGDEHEAVQRLLRRTGTGSPPPALESSDSFSLAHARGKLAVCALLAMHPRDLETGEQLRPELLFAEKLENAWRSIVRAPPVDHDQPPLALANRLLHPRRARSPAQLILACDDEGALTSHGLDAEACGSLRRGDARVFLALRSQLLMSRLKAYFERQAEWQRETTPPADGIVRTSLS